MSTDDTLSPERMAVRPTRDLKLIANAGAMPHHQDIVMALAGDLAAEELTCRGEASA
ncbi:hypothetical protein [Microbacterium sp. K5D]|uniref:hypothetical protein n=1 Tax=Microbacterium sp. K5D TaxID=2305436 RepID=UPI001443E3E9|nr:hypothetical protein [Microbacterium sp. K5D]